MLPHIMKNIITILILVAINLTAFAQKFDLKKINETDNNGLRQGLWFFYKLDTAIYKKYSILETSDQNKFVMDTIVTITVYKYGYYKNNLKDSIWNIYDPSTNYCWYEKNPNLSRTMAKNNLKYEAHLKNDSNGIIKEYSRNGNIKNEFEIKNKKIVGQIKCYNQNGTLEFIVNINPNLTYYEGSEYNLLGRKVKDKKFNTDFVNERINTDDFFNKLNK